MDGGIGALYAIFPDELVAMFGSPSGTNPVFLLAVGVPTFMSLLVAGLVSGRTGLRDLGARLVRWRAPWFWYALATLGVAALALGARTFRAAASGSACVDLFGQSH